MDLDVFLPLEQTARRLPLEMNSLQQQVLQANAISRARARRIAILEAKLRQIDEAADARIAECVAAAEASEHARTDALAKGAALQAQIDVLNSQLEEERLQREHERRNLDDSTARQDQATHRHTQVPLANNWPHRLQPTFGSNFSKVQD
jgi:hypothetical protein